MSTINLFCFPFAGANKYSYNSFRKFAQPSLNIIPLELPGRGGRAKERLLSSIDEMVEDMYNAIKEKVQDPYAIYGHSMGALLGYLTIMRIVEEQLTPPTHLFFTGCHAPGFKRNPSDLSHTLPDQEFLKTLQSYGGISSDILINKDFIDYYLPIFRSDFKAYETFQYQLSSPVDTPIMVFIGDEEKIVDEDLAMWQLVTTREVVVRKFKGHHFFIYNNVEEIFSFYKNALTTSVVR